MGQPCPGQSRSPPELGEDMGMEGLVCPEKSTPPCNFSSFQRHFLETFWVPLQWAGIVAQNCSHFSDDYLPVLLRFQLLVSCIMYFISSLSSVHKFSIYFHPGLRYSFTCKAGKVLFFFPCIFWSLIPVKHSSSFFCHQKAVSGDEVHILLLQTFWGHFLSSNISAGSKAHCLQLLSVPCCQ